MRFNTQIKFDSLAKYGYTERSDVCIWALYVCVCASAANLRKFNDLVRIKQKIGKSKN